MKYQDIFRIVGVARKDGRTFWEGRSLNTTTRIKYYIDELPQGDFEQALRKPPETLKVAMEFE